MLLADLILVLSCITLNPTMKKFSSYRPSSPAMTMLMMPVVLAIVISCSVIGGSCSEVRGTHHG
jgi:hypothetical protein